MERGEEEAREGSGRDLREDSGDRQGISWLVGYCHDVMGEIRGRAMARTEGRDCAVA